MEFRGDFETHFTITLDESGNLAALSDWGQHHELKCLAIVLDRGTAPSQPMLTRHSRGTLTQEKANAAEISRQLTEAGFTVSRIKIEAAPTNADVPRSDAEAGVQTDRYFEHHLKILLESDTDLMPLKQIAEQHAAHLSRNALKFREDGKQERFVTQRCFSAGSVTAHQQFELLLHALTTASYTLLKTEAEFVVYDSNLALDDGWIQSKE